MNRREFLAQSAVMNGTLQDIQFRVAWNRFARKANELMYGEQRGTWDVKTAREVRKMFEAITKMDGWRE